MAPFFGKYRFSARAKIVDHNIRKEPYYMPLVTSSKPLPLTEYAKAPNTIQNSLALFNDIANEPTKKTRRISLNMMFSDVL
jgi:hypothetical protein